MESDDDPHAQGTSIYTCLGIITPSQDPFADTKMWDRDVVFTMSMIRSALDNG